MIEILIWFVLIKTEVTFNTAPHTYVCDGDVCRETSCHR